jgi:3'-phosphoadenosine 5'-phosphosulfate sulfotransferase (PAPS reductase)/FAD synthetase
MKDKVPEMEYVFCDTGCELQETYEYLDKVETFLGKKIVRLNSDQPFDRWLEVYSGYLPSPRSRWCTRVMKIVPFERYVGNDTIYSYIGIRADEDREGYISQKPNIIPVYPLKEAGITEQDVHNLLKKSGLGLPKYYEWRSRSGCYFCFFQRRNEWVGLLEKHPDLFYKAKTYEKVDPKTNQKFTWVQNTTLGDIERDKNKIKERVAKLQKPEHEKKRLIELYEEFSVDRTQVDDDPGDACLICHL